MNDEIGNDKSEENDIAKGNDENFKTIDGNLDESDADQIELLKMEFAKLVKSENCENFCVRGGWLALCHSAPTP